MMKKFIFTIFFSLGIAASLPSRIEADKYTFLPLSPKQAVIAYASMYYAPAEPLLKLATCESNFNPKALGDQGMAFGVFQYHKATFEAFSRLMGQSLDYYSYYDQSKLTSWVWVNHPELMKQWTCFH